jgi:Domain of unknown function (DUF3459)
VAHTSFALVPAHQLIGLRGTSPCSIKIRCPSYHFTGSLHRQLLTLRKHYPSLTAGCYRPLHAAGDLLMYIRTYASADPILVALNLGPTPQIGEVENFRGRVLLSTLGERGGDGVGSRFALRPNEGLVILALASG